MDLAIFMISIERLIASTFIKSYEYMLNSVAHATGLVTLFLVFDFICSCCLFSDTKLHENSPTLVYVSFAATITRITGFFLLRLTQKISRRHLSGPDRTLSGSYQCHENIVLLLAHTYNLSVALSVFLTPTLLIALQPKLAAKFSKKNKTVHVSPMDAGTATATYFDELNKMCAANDEQALAAEHIEGEFQDSQASYYVKAYYAARFRLLRKLLFVEGEGAFIRSLSQSTFWTPQGGKSGRFFYRTQDDRFVVKQMPRFEIQSFVIFASHYFDYVKTAVVENKLTTLCKHVMDYSLLVGVDETNGELILGIVDYMRTYTLDKVGLF
ncbi:unnamed protein product [Cylicocyclus nassatus]|uniref:PIPK domain-containing protein n=1 Tax=Cylicocyclus nassatus TaxID=53992 RepID=A0AA36GYE5_CYLNA|nr:unnamed protein product [Cylicocyclus nassatus]